jgi:signal transduction histidine kinase
LGLRFLEQDRALETQRRRESVELAARRLAAAIERRLGETEEQLERGAGVVYRRETPEDPPAAEFAEAETLEFQQQDLVAAADRYRRLVESRRPALCAAALVRLGRVLRKQGKREEALAVYAKLEKTGSTLVAGQPAELLARQGRCRLYEEASDRAALEKEAAELASRLYSGVWPLDRPTFDLYREMAVRWGAPETSPVALARAEAARRLWQDWRNENLASRGRRLTREGDIAVLTVWAEIPAGLAVKLFSPQDVLPRTEPLVVSVYDTEDRPILGLALEAPAVLSAAETHLPFTLRVAAASAAGADGHFTRRRIVVAALALVFILVLAAAWGLYRVTTRELALAREQSDFVSAVSHEFRTPLTSLRHLTEMLASGTAPSEERKSYYYRLLAGETERLHRMVESLLAFGRLEARGENWSFEPLDAGELLRGVVEDFRRDPQAQGREVSWEAAADLPLVQADHEALSRAVWNLLENAAKYSPPGRPIRAFARSENGAALIGVEDQGSGIRPEEQQRIFRKFTRGAEAKRAGVRGVGIGLALVKRIVEGHGGSVRLESELGRGSTFTLVLPCLKS